MIPCPLFGNIFQIYCPRAMARSNVTFYHKKTPVSIGCETIGLIGLKKPFYQLSKAKLF